MTTAALVQAIGTLAHGWPPLWVGIMPIGGTSGHHPHGCCLYPQGHCARRRHPYRRPPFSQPWLRPGRPCRGLGRGWPPL
ncbi:hypothetical protein B296_00049097 [Ensete ventricosum]|uniref:Uncharacterized protein n=1 Tax=Ensete ventricosum TaxID=4639 RepID=A0A426XE87_ENSVE|nr:hypothetical protein B296_00049097 [Ensete ventricosum]